MWIYNASQVAPVVDCVDNNLRHRGSSPAPCTIRCVLCAGAVLCGLRAPGMPCVGSHSGGQHGDPEALGEAQDRSPMCSNLLASFIIHTVYHRNTLARKKKTKKQKKKEKKKTEPPSNTHPLKKKEREKRKTKKRKRHPPQKIECKEEEKTFKVRT